jgi:C_GCAxxG_C_C family probable redox protein
MIVKGELRFNCCESVVMMVHEKHPLPGFDDSVMRIASNFGGGVAGWGEICGALSGAAMAIGLTYGTDGRESLKAFDEKKAKERKITQDLLRDFSAKWGHVDCGGLLGCPNCDPEKRMKRYDELKAKGQNHCDEYVEWAAAKTLELI